MATVSDYLVSLQKLTKTNLDLLSAINQSFFTKQEHLQVNVDEQQYIIPSFISLENKINALQENFESLVHIYESGEAWMNIDGNSRVLELRGYTHTPPHLTLPNISTFGVSQNDIFKDFLTPVPYINFSLAEISNDITYVRVKKVIPLSDDLKSLFRGYLETQTTDDNGVITTQIMPSGQVTWGEIYKMLDGWTEDVDYISYEKNYQLPIRKNIGEGTWVIDTITEDIVDENLDNYITLKLRNDLTDYRTDLTYTLFDQSIQKNLKAGDIIITYDDTAKLQVVETYPSTNSIRLKVLNGEYLNFVAWSGQGTISDLSKIRFYSSTDFDKDKYINIPLEEDDLIFVAVAPLNTRMNVQSPWGGGLIISTSQLTLQDSTTKFMEYYKENVKNIGDILNNISNMMSGSAITSSPDEFQSWINATPVINTNDLEVLQINSHLNNSTTIQNIRSLYSQKKSLQSELSEIQTKITEIQTTLADISFDDTSGLRSAYESQLTEYNNKKNELTTSITKTIDSIAQEANDADIPIEDAKYRIRGFFDQNTFEDQLGIDSIKGHVCGIEYQYRYKNADSTQGNARAINDKFIFSDWNKIEHIDSKVSSYSNGFKYQPEYTDYDTNNINVPSFNQIDIPITQGETVDIKLRVIYDYGYPFVKTMSQWSEIVNIQFPEEFNKNVQITDIIEENNNDIETNRFKNIINEQGITDHINDKITDQSITYFHKPENIASGFYTEERRIIPLRDKLTSMDNNIIQLQDEILGTAADAIQVSVSIGDGNNILNPWQLNKISVQDWGSLYSSAQDIATAENTSVTIGSYEFDTKTNIASIVLNLTLTNISSRTVKLYSMFPGSRSTILNNLRRYRFDPKDYCIVNEEIADESNSKGIWLRTPDTLINEDSTMKIQSNYYLQTANQFITFRINDLNDATEYYKDGDQKSVNNILSLDKKYTSSDEFLANGGSLESSINAQWYAWLYPMLKEQYSLCLDGDTVNDYITFAPGEQIIIPLIFEYILYGVPQTDMPAITTGYISKIISFDLRTSLYNDPVNYIFQVTAKNSAKAADKLILNNLNNYGIKSTGSLINYNPVIK